MEENKLAIQNELTNVEYQLQEHNKKFDEVFNQLQLGEKSSRSFYKRFRKKMFWN